MKPLDISPEMSEQAELAEVPLLCFSPREFGLRAEALHRRLLQREGLDGKGESPELLVARACGGEARGPSLCSKTSPWASSEGCVIEVA